MAEQPDLLRTYNQFCPLARSLDILGERWTMLIIRNLFAGPQRYKDLLDGLPGIGTNLLAARLKKLEKEGIVSRHKLPPPAGSNVYELTELGWGLEEPIHALGRWGMFTLSRPREGAYYPPVIIAAGIGLIFNAKAAEGVHDTYEYRIDPTVFHVQVDDGFMKIFQGSASRPDLVITSDSDTWIAIGAGELPVPQAMADGKLRVQGEPEVIMRATRIFPPPRMPVR
jgi:DNA-binding HxlR family transcriptional regulator